MRHDYHDRDDGLLECASCSRIITNEQFRKEGTEVSEPRYKASYRWIRYNMRRGQEWFVVDTLTGKVVAEQQLWSRADAQFQAKMLNKELSEDAQRSE